MDLSIVTTMYCSAPYLEEFYKRVKAVAGKITDDYEIIFVNDGSPDDSLKVAISLFKEDEKVKVIDFSRNFGHHKAMMTGLMHAHGRLVFLIDCDLEIPPESLSEFYDKFQSSDVDVVYGVQAIRQDRLISKMAGSFFYTVFNWLSIDKLPANLTTARLMSQRYVSALVSHQEREVLIGGLWVITGFKQTALALNKLFKGKSSYTLKRKIAIIVNAITSFSVKPLVFVFYLGCIISSLSGLAALYLIIRRLFFGVLLAGWPSLIVSIWLLGGATIFCLGILGIYLSKIFMETKQRPYTIIRQIYEHPSKGEHAL
jgi:putative glycosyltransferase